MPMNLANVVDSSHVYSNKEIKWPEAFGDLSATVPVFVGEFGGDDTPADLDFGRRLVEYMRQLGIGWTAWGWYDEPAKPNHPLCANALLRYGARRTNNEVVAVPLRNLPRRAREHSPARAFGVVQLLVRPRTQRTQSTQFTI
jgi:hypothetical protein